MKRLLFLFLTLSYALHAQTIECDDARLREAHDLAVQTLRVNVRSGVLAAGADYGGEWTRDAAINCWNAASVLLPEVATQTLWSVTENRQRVGHQYWDKIIWTVAALHHYRVTGDRDFLLAAYPCAAATMAELESTAWNPQTGLFMGPAVIADGISAYPEPVFDPSNLSSYVLDHPTAGRMQCLSTNSLYLGAYKALVDLATAAGDPAATNAYREKAQALRQRILERFYRPGENRLHYLIDAEGQSHPQQEAIGYAFAVLFGVLEGDAARGLTEHAVTTPFGIPSVTPDFPRYSADRPGRHNHILWPVANGFFARACAEVDHRPAFLREWQGLTQLALDADKGRHEFWEIYHPVTGKPFGGHQAMGPGKPDELWPSCRLQTWSATAYLNMIHHGLAGLRFQADGLHLRPNLPQGLGSLRLTGLHYGAAELDLIIVGSGDHIAACHLDGRRLDKPFIPPDLRGAHTVLVRLQGD